MVGDKGRGDGGRGNHESANATTQTGCRSATQQDTKWQLSTERRKQTLGAKDKSDDGGRSDRESGANNSWRHIK